MQTVTRTPPPSDHVTPSSAIDLGIKRRDAEIKKIYQYSFFVFYQFSYRLLQGSAIALTILQAIPLVRVLKKYPVIILIAKPVLNYFNEHLVFHLGNLSYRTSESYRNALAYKKIYEKHAQQIVEITKDLTFMQKINPFYFPVLLVPLDSIEKELKEQDKIFAAEKYKNVLGYCQNSPSPEPNLSHYVESKIIAEQKKMLHRSIEAFLPLFLKTYKNEHHPNLSIYTYMAQDISDRRFAPDSTPSSQILVPKMSFEARRLLSEKSPLFWVHTSTGEAETAQTRHITYKRFTNILRECKQAQSSFDEFFNKIHNELSIESRESSPK